MLYDALKCSQFRLSDAFAVGVKPSGGDPCNAGNLLHHFMKNLNMSISLQIDAQPHDKHANLIHEQLDL